MFLTNYTLLEAPVICKVFSSNRRFSLERKVTDYLKQLTQQAGWKYLRIDTTTQSGFPDILLLKRKTYWQIEAKVLKKKKLRSLEDDIKWQYGQIGYMKRALTLNLNYMLVVAKDNEIAFMKGNANDSKRTCYPNFVEQL